MRKSKLISTVLFAFIALLISQNIFAQQIVMGAYYFDGWTGGYRKKLMEDFPERQPKWGWKTSTSEVMDEQIILAHDAGLSFFSFCWYFKRGRNMTLDADEHNNALSLFLNSKYKNKLKFNLMVSNDAGYRINASDWGDLCNYWCSMFKDPSYLMVDNKPLITFLNLPTLLQTFKTPEKLKAALDELRLLAVKNHFQGVTIAVSTYSAELATLAGNCGFDAVTSYNNHGYGLWTKNNVEVVPIDQMLREKNLWATLASASKLPVIPTVTLNWDRRPLDAPNTKSSPRFSGFSQASVNKAIESCVNWMGQNSNLTTKENIAVIYAWNEYGEGAYLTPTKNGENLLDGVKKNLRPR